MAAKSVQQETSEVILLQFGQVKEAIAEGKQRVESVANELKASIQNLAQVVSELKSKELSDMKSEVAVLKDRAGRSGAIWGAIGGALIAAIVSAFFGLLKQ